MVQPEFDLDRMRAAVRVGAIEWHRHALEQMAPRGITRAGVFETLLTGDCIESYATGGRPFPDALFLGWFRQRPLHVVVAFDSRTERVHIVTVYEPDREHFLEDFRTRRR